MQHKFECVALINKYQSEMMNSIYYFGGCCPFIFHVPTNTLISLNGNTRSNSDGPSSEFTAKLFAR